MRSLVSNEAMPVKVVGPIQCLHIVDLLAGAVYIKKTKKTKVVGSFSRSAANAAYDSQSPMCNLITGIECVLFLWNVHRMCSLPVECT